MKFASERIQKVVESATVALSDRARAMAQQGIDVISLAGGEPDFKTPDHIIRAGCRSMDEGATHYVSSRGIPALLQAISDKYEAEQGLRYEPKSEVLVTPGGKLALYAAIMGTIDAGDEVLLPEPAWVSYFAMIQMSDGVPVSVPLRGDDNFTITRDLLESKVTPRSRMILINSPNNPTGRVYTRDELEAVAQVAQAHDLLVVSDEIYEKLLYDGHEHISIASLPDMRDRTIIVNGLSKSHAMTGWRLGFAVAPKPIIDEMLKVQQHTATCAAAFTQAAGVAAFNSPQDAVYEMLDVYRQRRKLVVEGLNSLPGVACAAPEGAFYAFPDISGTGMTAQEFSAKMLEDAQVAMTPGDAFGMAGEGYVRLSFANATDLLERAIDRLRKVL